MIIKYLAVLTFILVSSLIFVLFRMNPHPKKIKSDVEYANSKNYKMEYSIDDTEDKSLTHEVYKPVLNNQVMKNKINKFGNTAIPGISIK